ncbi:MAG TPA: alpha/beta hydrolase [Allosphingosinicella sp.]|nr:alpha/beta hydrolase [Allosphingosinicella sp.]
MIRIDYLAARDGVHLAYQHRPGRGPTLVFLPGYRSDMEGTKALALDAWAEGQGRAMLRFDHAGCGLSGGDFEAQTLRTWLDDALTMIDRVVEGPVVLAGSSMGGWLMLHMAMARPARIAALVGIAAAPDFTNWGFDEAQKRTLLSEGRLVEPSPYGEPVVTTRAFWESGEALRMLHVELPIDCPVRLLHGLADTEVPYQRSWEIGQRVRSADVQISYVKQGDHRLSREEDIALLIATVSTLLESL